MHKKDRRERFDIIYEILTILSDGSVYKTMLAHKAKLDSRTIDKYVNLLQRVNLITVEKEREDGGGRYILRITEKGRIFLNLYEELMNLIRF
ncbi:MAG: winged helix-turn-helix domain-containing protein [Candidatus Nitrosocaldus sp.]